eukprot:gene22-3418_t
MSINSISWPFAGNSFNYWDRIPQWLIPYTYQSQSKSDSRIAGSKLDFSFVNSSCNASSQTVPKGAANHDTFQYDMICNVRKLTSRSVEDTALLSQ